MLGRTKSQGGQAVSETPRTDRARLDEHDPAVAVASECSKLERELNAANKRIKELEAKVDELHDLEKWLEGR
jgi:predicted  nucleic acid-binding Zn-ribbon protein